MWLSLPTRATRLSPRRTIRGRGDATVDSRSETAGDVAFSASHASLSGPHALREDYFVYIGSYTDALLQRRKVSMLARFDAETGKLYCLSAPRPKLSIPLMSSPQHLMDASCMPRTGRAEAIKEGKNDTVTAYAVNRKTGALSLLDKVDAGGSCRTR